MQKEYTEQYIKDAVNVAIAELLKNDRKLLELDVNERSITHKFAEYLKTEFPDWDVDCEYNRDGHDTKKVCIASKQVSSDDSEGTTVYPDIIVHKRGMGNNLLVIEAKKDTNCSDADKFDKEKLGAYKRELKYKFALFTKFFTGKNQKDPKLEYI